MGFLAHCSWFAAFLCLLYKGDVVWCDCTLKDIGGGNYTLSNELKVGSVLRYQCAEGFYPYPALALQCQPNDMWDPVPRRSQRCKMVECPDPTVLQNGNISPLYGSRQYFNQNQIKYTCYSGYTLYGPSQRICLKSGKWSGSNPVCRRDLGDCPDPGVPPGGTRSGDIFENGHKVIYSCKNNMILMGSEERECQLNGYWSGTEPSCYYKHTYDLPLEVSMAFWRQITNVFALHLSEKPQQPDPGIKIRITQNKPLNMFIAVDVSESIDKEDHQNAKEAIITLIQKLETLSLTSKNEVVFFSSKIHPVVNILDFYGSSQPEPMSRLLLKIRNSKIENDSRGTNLNAVFESFLEKMVMIKEQVPNFSEHQHVIVLFTNGGYNMGGAPTQTIERIKSLVYMDQPQNRQQYLDIFVFGFGSPIYDDVLKPLTVGTGERHYFRLKNLYLHETFEEIFDEEDVMVQCGLHKLKTMNDEDLHDVTEKRKKFPWAVEVSSTFAVGKVLQCSGSLVSPRFVLTAAQCVSDKPDDVKVEWLHGQMLEVKAVHVHPDFDISAKKSRGISQFFDYDVALIELQTDAPMNISLRPICIPCTVETNMALRHNFTCKEQEDFLLWNYARVNFLNRRHLEENSARVKLGNHRQDCIAKVRTVPSINTTDVTQVVTENFLCTGGRHPSLDNVACPGDSGGAVFKNFEHRTIQVGLVSWGTTLIRGCFFGGGVDSNENSRDFHINLFKVVPFLKSILGNQMQTYAPLHFVD